MRVAVDQAGHRSPSAPVELDQLGREAPCVELPHMPDSEDPPRVAEDVRVLDQPELAERRTAERRSVSRGRDDLSQVSEKERRHDRAQSVRPGTRSPCSRAASSASS